MLKNHRGRNEYHVAYNKKIRDERRQYVRDYLESHPCVDCGETDPIVLEFDHVRGDKSANVSRIANNTCSVERLQAEIDKCEVRCANCHRRATYARMSGELVNTLA